MTMLEEIVLLGVSYLLAFGGCIAVMVYVLNIPGAVTGEQCLVDEYYRTNASTSIPLDMMLVGIYLLIGQYIIYKSGILHTGTRLGIIATTTLALSGTIYGGFRVFSGTESVMDPDDDGDEESSSFFTRWFLATGWSAVAYDIIYVNCIYAVMVNILRVLEMFRR